MPWAMENIGLSARFGLIFHTQAFSPLWFDTGFLIYFKKSVFIYIITTDIFRMACLDVLRRRRSYHTYSIDSDNIDLWFLIFLLFHNCFCFYLIIIFLVFPDFILTMFTPFCGSWRRLPLRS